MKKHYAILACCTVLLFFPLVSSCKAKPVADVPVPPVSPSPEPQKIADHQVLVMLGSDYSLRTSLLDGLVSEYGLNTAGGMLLPLFYPESFTRDKRIRLSLLSETAALGETTIVVVVAGPEGTARELSKIRNAHPSMQIISLFPQEDILALEAVSSLVIDYTVAGDLLAAEDIAFLSDSEIGVLLLASVLFGEDPDPAVSPLLRLTRALDSARSALKQKNTGPKWSIASYVDPETNLRSWNHVMLETGRGESR